MSEIGSPTYVVQLERRSINANASSQCACGKYGEGHGFDQQSEC